MKVDTLAAQAACWDIPGVDICARGARGLFVTSVRDFMAYRQPEALKVCGSRAECNWGW